MGLHPTKLEEMARVSLRNTLRGNPKTKLQSHPNSVFFSTNNEKQTTKAQRDFLKRKRPQPEHNSPKRYVEVGMIDLHRIPDSNIVPNPRQPTSPRRSGFPRGEEVESRGWRRGAPQSPSPSSFGAPQGNNEIYTYDVVFSPGEARIKSKEQRRFLIIKHRKSANAV